MPSLELLIEHTLIASHSLEFNEAPHPHRWVVEFTVGGNPVRGKIVDLPGLSKAIEASLKRFEKVYLNEYKELDEAGQAFPTCETLCANFSRITNQEVFAPFRDTNPSLKLVKIKVTLCEMDGSRWGSAQLWL